MPLDPAAKLIIDQLNSSGAPPLNSLSVSEARAAATALFSLHGEPPPMARVQDRRIPGPEAAIPVRIYAPSADVTLPMLVYYHGGGWVLGDLESHDATCRTLAAAAGCLVVAVDYRLAPEHKFPAAAEDAYAAARWAAEHAAGIDGDPTRLAVAGDSAGGNLAAVVSLMARDRGAPALRYQVLIYPVTGAPGKAGSYAENGNGYLLTADMMQWFWQHYVRTAADEDNPYAAPLRAPDLRRLPPALILTAEFDPLRDDGEAYAERLRGAGVPVTLRRYDGMIHGFFGMRAVLPQAGAAAQEIGAALRAAFGTSAEPS
jgi:acetyl esterase